MTLKKNPEHFLFGGSRRCKKMLEHADDDHEGHMHGDGKTVSIVVYRTDGLAHSVTSVNVNSTGANCPGHGELVLNDVPIGNVTVSIEGENDNNDCTVVIDAWEPDATHYCRLSFHLVSRTHLHLKRSTLLEYETVRKDLLVRNVVSFRPAEMHVYRILLEEEWDAIEASSSKLYEGAALDKQHGFIHLSCRAQVPGTLALYFKGKKVVVLEFRTESFEGLLKFEAPVAAAEQDGQVLFPHLYAPHLDCSLATRVIKTISDL